MLSYRVFLNICLCVCVCRAQHYTGTLLISKIREEYPDRVMSTYSIIPSPKVCVCVRACVCLCVCVRARVRAWSACLLAGAPVCHNQGVNESPTD